MIQEKKITLTGTLDLANFDRLHLSSRVLGMFSHIMVGADDIQASKTFYDAVLGALGYEPGVMSTEERCYYRSESGVFAITKPINGEPACHGNGSTIGFTAETTAAADAWHAAGIANGGSTCEDAPGIRKSPNGDLYLAYLLDPAGNKICVLRRMG